MYENKRICLQTRIYMASTSIIVRTGFSLKKEKKMVVLKIACSAEGSWSPVLFISKDCTFFISY